MTWYASQDIVLTHSTMYEEVVDHNGLLSYCIDDIIECDDKQEWVVVGVLRGFEGHNKYIVACCLKTATIKELHLKAYPVSLLRILDDGSNICLDRKWIAI